MAILLTHLLGGGGGGALLRVEFLLTLPPMLYAGSDTMDEMEQMLSRLLDRVRGLQGKHVYNTVTSLSSMKMIIIGQIDRRYTNFTSSIRINRKRN